MITIAEINDLEQVYEYHLQFCGPYFTPRSFPTWKESFLEDIDGGGRRLFRELSAKAAYDNGQLIGFVQYGKSAFGFDAQGNICSDVSYQIIRNLYFDSGRADAGEQLLQEALARFSAGERVYAFFHYFGMSCFARHGKLFEDHRHIDALLKRHGFAVEHENVYYSSVPAGNEVSQICLEPQEMTAGDQQYIDFLLSGNRAGGCEVHFVDETRAYLRWIYVNGDITGKGIGTQCMNALKRWLSRKGITEFDTDTALSNSVAQHYYEKNGFTREGITRSYYRS